VELGDFDPTSTSIGIYPCGEKERLPQNLLNKTFERYLEYFLQKMTRFSVPKFLTSLNF